MESISKIYDYKRALVDLSDLENLIEYLYSNGIIDEENYYEVWENASLDNKIDLLFEIVVSKKYNDIVLQYLKDSFPKHEEKLEQERIRHMVTIRGGFPELPPNYVLRKSLVNSVRPKLLNLQLNQKLIIHGMVGYGKSCLINDLLRDNVVQRRFDLLIFWLKLGDCQCKEDALQPMRSLLIAANSVLNKTTNHCPDDFELLKEQLKESFLTERLKYALIVLDNVACKQVLQCFDIGCKTVVTTQDKKIFDNIRNCIFEEVTTGFSLTESLQLFKKCLNTDENLPDIAEEIHTICQGHPMLISLIGSFLSDHAVDIVGGNDKIWLDIKDEFYAGNYSLDHSDKNVMPFHEKLSKCIEKLLDKNLLSLYKELVIFEPDVNIPPEVLEILWRKSSLQVRSIMNKLAEKSLVVRFYHHDRKTFIYGIHKIYLNYLRQKIENIKYIHKKLIDGYDELTGGDYTKLPNDNYTLQFIGYNLLKAEEIKKFNIYFDLKFLEIKLKATGKEDVLRDFDRYEIYITKKDPILMEKLKQLKRFIERCGTSMYNYPKTDIIQYALRENPDSYVYKMAVLMAQESPHLYFLLQKPWEELDFPIKTIKDDITSACFVDSRQHILIGTTSGKIKLFYDVIDKEISNFVGHTNAIRNLIVSRDKKYFLSVSDDHTVRLWKFTADGRRSRDFSNDSLLVSPKNKQSLWKDIHTGDAGQTKCLKIFQLHESVNYLISAAFYENFPDTFHIVTGTNNGNAIVWDAETGKQLYHSGNRGSPALCVTHKIKDGVNYIIFSCKEDIITCLLNENNQLTFKESLVNPEKCTLFFCFDEDTVVVSDNLITFFNVPLKKQKKRIRNSDVLEKNICATLSNDNQYLVVSTNQNAVYILDINEKKILRRFENKGLPKSLDTLYDEDMSVHVLLIGSDKRTLQICYIQPHESQQPLKSLKRFTPYWKGKNPLVATAGSDNKLQVFSGGTLISESDILPSQVTYSCFSITGNRVICGLENGTILMFHLKTKTKTILQEPRDSPVKYLKCFDPSNTYQYKKPSTLSGGSTDSLDVADTDFGVIVAIFEDNKVSVYKNGNIFTREIISPIVFNTAKQLLLVDANCKVFSWNIETDDFNCVNNISLFDQVTLDLAAFSPHKSLFALFYTQNNLGFFDICLYKTNGDSSELNSQRRFECNEKITCARFSCDASLLALGFNSGNIKVYDLENYQYICLDAHDDPVQHLIFSPYKVPILVSLGEEIAWWKLSPIQNSSKIIVGKPKRIDILGCLTHDLNTMDISFWSDRKPLENSKYLLSIVKMEGRTTYISSSNDFNSFLIIDHRGQVYLTDILVPVPDFRIE